MFGAKSRMEGTLRLLRKLLGILGFLYLWITVEAQIKIPPETVQQWASEFSVQLRDLTVKYSGSLLLQKKLKDVESIIKITELNGEDLVKDFSNEIERMLGSKMKSVKRLAESAEDADLYHEFNASLKFDYYNSMMINTVDEDGNSMELGGEFPLEENQHFNNIPVNTQQSNIQVPTNVYNKDPIILNAIYNTEALNDVFISNFLKDPTLTWQYIQAATSPKDIIIMVDISGSMKGLKMTIAKHTINTILDTLGENDFVNIIAVRVNGQGSMCNQAIMLITDGAMEDFESVFEEFNWPDRRMEDGSEGYALDDVSASSDPEVASFVSEEV
ncbi:hypothetical protein fugu_011991 [Takifugu bimaculatus]|uniref:VWA N-terminal domain-containing protein n=1 Tax=Takifugu bimaculatus TaxID=433685 RepID=A0A4Z2C942_9TELE|nr:hypothetical protein fugu_011991 [Takifugu bimaculatus]